MGVELFESTSSCAPFSIAIRWASERLPTTTTSPSEMPVREVSIACTHTRPDSALSSPRTSRPSSTSRMAFTCVGASRSVEVSRVSRM